MNSGYIDMRLYYLSHSDDKIDIRIDVYLRKDHIFKELHILDEV